MLFFILLSIILFIFGLYYYYENKKLKQKIKELEQETKTILERKIINNKEDLIPIENISIQPTIQEKNIIPNTKEKEQSDIKEKNTSLEYILTDKDFIDNTYIIIKRGKKNYYVGKRN